MVRLKRIVANSILALIMAISPGLTAFTDASAVELQGDLTLVSTGEISGLGIHTGSHPTITDDGRYVVFDGILTPPNSIGRQIFIRDTVTNTSEMVSVNNLGQPGNASVATSSRTSISADGRYVAFVSNATNLVDNDTNGVSDVFVRDRENGTTKRVNVSSDGTEANAAPGLSPRISGDGRYIVFDSLASNLVPDDTNNASDVFMHDIQTGTTSRISVNSDGDQAICTSSTGLHVNCQIPNSAAGPVSSDGRYVLFRSGANNLTPIPPLIIANGTYGAAPQIYLRDTANNTTTLVTESDIGTRSRYGGTPQSLTDDGRFIVFSCTSSALGCGFVPEGDSGIGQVYVRDMVNGTITKVSVNDSGEQANTAAGVGIISSDGTRVIFGSSANNLVSDDIGGTTNLFVRNLTAQTTTRLTSFESGTSISQITFSQDGRFIAFRSQDNLTPDVTSSSFQIFLLDRLPDSTAPVLGETMWTSNPLNVGSYTSFSIPATDDLSGVATGEYFISTDPGVGSATPLIWDGTNLNSDDFGATLQPGVYDIGIRAKDAAGNWSAALTTHLVVFDPNGPSQVIGQQLVKPGTGDTLPWISTDNKDFASFGFNVKFTPTGTVDPDSEFGFNYTEKGNCNSPNTPACNSFVLTATGFDWFALSGTNNSVGTFQGSATLSIDSATPSNVLLRVEAVDGNQLTPSQSDSFVLKVWSEDSNPQTDSPLYQVSADFTPSSGNANGGIQVKQ